MKLVAFSLVLFAVLYIPHHARSQSPKFVPPSQAADPVKEIDPEMKQQLEKDVVARNPHMNESPVLWTSNENGYFGKYMVGSTDYVTHYDDEGGYLETYVKGNWNDVKVSPSIKAAFAKSQFKSHAVKSFWIISDPGKKGYFFEMEDKDGLPVSAWVNEKGKFSTNPPKYTTGS